VSLAGSVRTQARTDAGGEFAKSEPTIEVKHASPSAIQEPDWDAKSESSVFHVLRGRNLNAEETSAAYKRLFNTCFPGEVRSFADADYVVVYGATPRVESWRAFCIVRPTLKQKSRTYRWPTGKLLRRLPASAAIRYDIMDLGIDTVLRGRGIGKRLLTHVLATIRTENTRLFSDQLGHHSIDVQTYATNPIALAVYLQHGFHVARETASINHDTHLPDRYIELTMTV
jgi:ribosomal protein S18 acetylase RimI-like enzyme